jgi:hypothetical protein
LVKDEAREALLDDAPWGTEQLETCQLDAMWARQHGDLHGDNVLVNEDLHPMLIDFGRAGRATASLDPVTLEISAVLQPQSGVDFGGWMSPGRAETWMDEEAYLEDCPIRPFVEACRRWAGNVSRGNREVAATVYAYGLRQMQYSDVDAQLAAAFSYGAARYLADQYGL